MKCEFCYRWATEICKTKTECILHCTCFEKNINECPIGRSDFPHDFQKGKCIMCGEKEVVKV